MTTADLVEVAVTGEIYYGPTGTALPTNAFDTINASFAALGYISEDGITQTINEDRTDIKAWQNGDIVRKVRTSHDYMLQFAMLETSLETLAVYYGDGSVSGTLENGAVQVKGDMDTRGEWIFEIVDGDDLIRVVVPDGQVTERGDVEYVNGDAIKYPVTITGYPDDSDVKAYIYLATDTGS